MTIIKSVQEKGYNIQKTIDIIDLLINDNNPIKDIRTGHF